MITAKSELRNQPIDGIDGEIFRLRLETVHDSEKFGSVQACTAVHDQIFARRIGGVRFVTGPPPKDRVELGELASAMTWKCALAGLPSDGEKSVIYCSDVENPEDLPNDEDAAAILAEHLVELTAADRGVIFGPDIHCGEGVMTLLAHRHGYGDHVSGLLQGQGGLSIDGHGYTARGLEAGLLAASQGLGWDVSSMRASIQGFGAVGAHTALNLASHGVTLSAVSTSWGALIATSPVGLPIEILFNTWMEEGDDAFRRYQLSPPTGCRWANRDAVFTVPAEIFVPAARTDALATSEEIARELPEAFDVNEFASQAGVRVVLEGANHPLSDDAERYLQTIGVYVLPDYLVNCGGLIGCWADWAYRQELQSSDGATWFDDLDQKTPQYVKKIVENNVHRVLDLTDGQPTGFRDATYRLAADRRLALQQELVNLLPLEELRSDNSRALAKALLNRLFGD
jgi:glutamate dehydrogenase (NAD(P)+)